MGASLKKILFLKVGGWIKTIIRKKYLDRLIELVGTDIKIITGNKAGQLKTKLSLLFDMNFT